MTICNMHATRSPPALEACISVLQPDIASPATKVHTEFRLQSAMAAGAKDCLDTAPGMLCKCSGHVQLAWLPIRKPQKGKLTSKTASCLFASDTWRHVIRTRPAKMHSGAEERTIVIAYDHLKSFE